MKNYCTNSFPKKIQPLFVFVILLFLSTQLSAQRTLTGKITDSSNEEPLIGASVIIEGSTRGTITDFDGNFSLNINSDDKTLKISYTGYTNQIATIGESDVINIALEEGVFGLEAITVTARKSIENVQEVPIAVATFSAKMLGDRGVGNVGQLAEYIPNVEIDVTTAFAGTQSALSPFIRGIGQNDFSITAEPAVGLYVDGVYYGRGVGSVIDMLDVERIEVLKGPQGTLFGRNTIAGAINITTKEPGNEFKATGQLMMGSYNRMDTKLSVDAPLVEDKLLSSFSISSINRDGYVERIPFEGELSPADLSINDQIADGQYTSIGLTNDQGNMNNDTFRGKLLWKASDNFKVTLSGDYVRIRENESAGSLIEIIDDPNNFVSIYNATTQIPAAVPIDQQPPFAPFVAGLPGQNPLFGRTPYDSRFITGDPFTNYSTGEAGSKIDVWGAALTLDWTISDYLSLKSITSRRSLRSEFGADTDFSPLEYGRVKQDMPQDQFTQEFQLTGTSDKLKWVAGFYHFREDGSLLDQASVGAGLVQIIGFSQIENKTYAGFAQATYNLTDSWSVTGGLRYTYEDKLINVSQREFNGFGTWGLPDAAFPDPSDKTQYYPQGDQNQTFNVPTVRLGTEYKISDDVFAYGYFAQGFKSGGWTTRVTAPTLEAPTHNPEKTNTYEIGFKSEFLDNRLRFNVAGFYTDYQDLQVTVFLGISPTVVNAAQATISGVEADLQFRATENLTLSANMGILNTKYSSIEDERATVQEGFLFINAPKFSGGLALDLVSTQNRDKGRFGLHLDTNYRSEVANDAENSSFLIQDGYALLNGNVFYEPANRKWKIMAGGSNLGDQLYLNAGTFTPGSGTAFATYGRPREFSIGLSYTLQ